MKQILSLCLAFICMLSIVPVSTVGIFVSADSTPIKTRGTIYTREMIANARENIEIYSWAKRAAERITASADKWLERGYDLVLELMPSNQIWRSGLVNSLDGCPHCGMENYNKGNNYNWSYDNPWKIICPTCEMIFPSNDFEAYYKSGLDKKGNFIRKNADHSLLVNTLYPEKGKNWCVDDGTGMYNEKGQCFAAIGYCARSLWAQALSYMNTVFLAYLYTGEQKYADFIMVVLDRLADLYPGMTTDYETIKPAFVSSNGGSAGQGKILGRIEEASLIVFSTAYDAIFYAFPTISQDTLQYINKRSNGTKKTYQDIMVNIEQGLIFQIYPNILSRNIGGNMGMHQRVLTLAAKCIDAEKYTKPWLDFVFRYGNGTTTGGNMNNLLIESIDRDGMGNEAAPDYNSGWLSNFIGLAEALHGYTIKDTNISYDMFNNPKFKKMFLCMYNLVISDIFTPKIGDTSQTGDAIVLAKPDLLLTAYEVYGDYVYAQAIYDLMEGKVSSINSGIFTKNPEAIQGKILADIEYYGEYQPKSLTLSGYGFSVIKNRTTFNSVATQPLENNSLSAKNLTFSTEAFLTLSDTEAKFSSAKKGDVLHIGFSWQYVKQTYEIILNTAGNGSGKVNVYIDGKLLQSDVSIENISNLFFTKTISLTTGYHMITLETLSKETSLSLQGILFTMQSSGERSSSVSKTVETTAALYYGINHGHGHKDSLNLFLYAFNVDLSPDMGNPEFKNASNPHRYQVVMTTLSHNTVVVDEYSQNVSIDVGTTRHFTDGEYVQLIDGDATDAYAQCSLYARTVATVKISESDAYILDFFRVKGGSQHKYSFHVTQTKDVRAEGLNLVKQVDGNGKFVGSYAGEHVEFGTISYGSESLKNSRGYQWYNHVERDSNPSACFSFDWTIDDIYKYSTNVKEDIHLKMTMLGDYDEVALTDGVPPRNKVGNPTSMDYVFITNAGRNLESAFVSVFEPYDSANGSAIQSIEEVEITQDGKAVHSYLIKAVKVTLNNGRIDYIVCSYDTKSIYRIGDLFDFCGYFGVYTVSGEKTMTWLHDATLLGEMKTSTALQGKIHSFTKDLALENSILVSFDQTGISADSLAGLYLKGDPNASKNPFYEILSAAKNKDGTYTLNIGDISLISGYENSANPAQGYLYQVYENQKFSIARTEMAGDINALKLTQPVSTITAVTLSHEIQKGAKKGDFVGYLFAVDSAVTDLKSLPAY
ncbi:MAG TPA: hypothetical protein DCY74_00085, partial [Clostridiales bacterium]|nr:hypothetical protein [Clostridiales bacterium]